VTDIESTTPATAPANGGRKVLLAAPRGYCAGVDRAVVTVEKAVQEYRAEQRGGRCGALPLTATFASPHCWFGGQPLTLLKISHEGQIELAVSDDFSPRRSASHATNSNEHLSNSHRAKRPSFIASNVVSSLHATRTSRSQPAFLQGH